MGNDLKSFAEKYGYKGELCSFLDALEYNNLLVMFGLDIVGEALQKRMKKDDIIKIALANVGNAFPADDGEQEEPETLEDYAKEGEKRFKRYCDDAGHFRFDLFKRIEPHDVNKVQKLYEDILGDDLDEPNE